MPVVKTKSTKSSGKRRAVKARDFAQLGLRGKGKWSTQTYHEGANDERTATIAHIRRELKKVGGTGLLDGDALIVWLLDRNERYKKNPRGL